MSHPGPTEYVRPPLTHSNCQTHQLQSVRRAKRNVIQPRSWKTLAPQGHALPTLLFGLRSFHRRCRVVIGGRTIWEKPCPHILDHPTLPLQYLRHLNRRTIFWRLEAVDVLPGTPFKTMGRESAYPCWHTPDLLKLRQNAVTTSIWLPQPQNNLSLPFRNLLE
jgi:hypothetical protein